MPERLRGAALRAAEADRRARALSRATRQGGGGGAGCGGARPSSGATSTRGLTPWQKTLVARHPDRPYTLDYVEAPVHRLHRAARRPPLRATTPRSSAASPSTSGRPVAVIGHQKGRDTKQKIYRNFGMPKPEGYRKALRVMQLAEKFAPADHHLRRHARAPIPASTPRSAARPRRSPSTCARWRACRVPIVVNVTGEGGSGGALAIAVGDRVNMLEHSVYSVISPEGCASILWRDAGRAEEAADRHEDHRRPTSRRSASSTRSSPSRPAARTSIPRRCSARSTACWSPARASCPRGAAGVPRGDALREVPEHGPAGPRVHRGADGLTAARARLRRAPGCSGRERSRERGAALRDSGRSHRPGRPVRTACNPRLLWAEARDGSAATAASNAARARARSPARLQAMPASSLQLGASGARSAALASCRGRLRQTAPPRQDVGRLPVRDHQVLAQARARRATVTRVSPRALPTRACEAYSSCRGSRAAARCEAGATALQRRPA